MRKKFYFIKYLRSGALKTNLLKNNSFLVFPKKQLSCIFESKSLMTRAILVNLNKKFNQFEFGLTYS